MGSLSCRCGVLLGDADVSYDGIGTAVVPSFGPAPALLQQV
jgi:hypothetical protein